MTTTSETKTPETPETAESPDGDFSPNLGERRLDDIRLALASIEAPVTTDEVWDLETVSAYTQAKSRFAKHAPQMVAELLELVDSLQERLGIIESGDMPEDTHRNRRCTECGATDKQCGDEGCCDACREVDRAFVIWEHVHRNCRRR